MIWPTISGKSYVGETVKSMTTGELESTSEALLAKNIGMVLIDDANYCTLPVREQ